MFFIIVLVHNVLQVQSNRQTSPFSRIIREEIDEINYYTSNVNQSILLQFTNYLGIFDISLASLKQGKLSQIAKEDLQSYNLKEGCQPSEGDVKYKQLFNLIPLLNDETIDNTQGKIIGLYTTTNNIFVVRSDLKLFILKLFYDLDAQEIVDLKQVSYVDFKTILLNETVTQNISDSFLTCYQLQTELIDCYVFTELGTIKFSYNQVENKILSLNQINVELSAKIKDVHLDYQNKLLLIMSQMEVIVFQLRADGSLREIQKLILSADANLMQVKTNKNGTHIFILDKKLGVLIYQIDKLNFNIKQCDQNIQIRGGRAFDFSEKTMYILLETEDEFLYVLELFYDLEEKEYYFNKIRFEEQEIHDVYVGETLTILIGSDVHSIIENQIYHKFQQTEKQVLFNKNNLVELNGLQLPWVKQVKDGYPFEYGLLEQIRFKYDEQYMVGMTEKEINLFVLNKIFAWVVCKAEDAKREIYQLRIKSKRCPSMEQDIDPFIICDSSLNFTFEGLEVYFYEQNTTQFLVIVCFVILTLIGLVVTFLFFKNKNYIEAPKELYETQITQKDDNYLDSQQIPTQP
ncbi:unnamed protein product [Paramecium sonneborni]|uniref:Transmembrane protein n=1 Tax=Paramecium sonneborni TaxID=65129 RepID=A0A8S1MUY8_9CILI|nr:unnamed protein product [Paramecium sonneborni]